MSIKEGLHPSHPHTHKSTISNVGSSKEILIFSGNIFPQQNLIDANHFTGESLEELWKKVQRETQVIKNPF